VWPSSFMSEVTPKTGYCDHESQLVLRLVQFVLRLTQGEAATNYAR